MAQFWTITPVNLFDFTFNDLLGTTVSANASTVTIDLGNGLFHVYSGNFTYDVFTRALSGGEITSVRLTDFTTDYYQLTGPAFPVANLLSSFADNPLGLLADIFSGQDAITGSAGNDTLAAFWGSDTVHGGAGDDWVFGGGAIADPSDSADVVYGGSGSDTVLGNAGDDTIYGSGFDPLDALDDIYGGKGNDLIFGNGSGDLISGDEGNDTIYGGAGDDKFYYLSGSGNDMLMQLNLPGQEGGDVLVVAGNINSTGIATPADILSCTAYADGNAFIDVGAGNSITIVDMPFGSLSADDFEVF